MAEQQQSIGVTTDANTVPTTGQYTAPSVSDSTTIPGNLVPAPSPSAVQPYSLVNGVQPFTSTLTPFGQLMSKPSSTTGASDGVAILCARGTTMVTNLGSNSASKTAGFYAIEEWNSFKIGRQQLQNASSVGSAIASNAPQTIGDWFNAKKINNLSNVINAAAASPLITAPVLITGVSINERDVYSATLCMNNIKVFYSFGQNFGDVAITGEILLGNFGDQNLANGAVKLLADFFWKYRVSNFNDAVHVSAVNEKFLVYLVGIDFGEINPDFHIMPFVMHGVLLDVSRNSTQTLNQYSQVVNLNTSGLYNTSVIAALSKTTNVTVQTGTSDTTAGITAPPNAANAATGTSTGGIASTGTINTFNGVDTGQSAVTEPLALYTANPLLAGTAPGKAYVSAYDDYVANPTESTQKNLDDAGTALTAYVNAPPPTNTRAGQLANSIATKLRQAPTPNSNLVDPNGPSMIQSIYTAIGPEY